MYTVYIGLSKEKVTYFHWGSELHNWVPSARHIFLEYIWRRVPHLMVLLQGYLNGYIERETFNVIFKFFDAVTRDVTAVLR